MSLLQKGAEDSSLEVTSHHWCIHAVYHLSGPPSLHLPTYHLSIYIYISCYVSVYLSLSVTTLHPITSLKQSCHNVMLSSCSSEVISLNPIVITLPLFRVVPYLQVSARCTYFYFSCC